jgi:putative aldouronate transport system permease protein
MSASPAARTVFQKEGWQDKAFDCINLVMVIAVLLIMVYPLYLVVICSFSDANLVSLGKVTLYPRNITFQGYQALFIKGTIWRSYINSVVYTVAGTLISVSVTMGAAFTLSCKFPGRRVISLIFVFTMFFNGGLVPTFLVVRDIGLYNSPWICILMGCVSVWNVMVARTYITSTILVSLL